MKEPKWILIIIMSELLQPLLPHLTTACAEADCFSPDSEFNNGLNE